ncbi:hypothetical protein [Nocardia rhamnosiphila]
MAEEGEKYGLDIELVEFNRYSDMRVALENGSIDFGTVGPGDVALSADSRKSQLVALAGEATGADLLAKRAGSGPLSWKDLASGSIRFGSFGAGIAWVKTPATRRSGLRTRSSLPTAISSTSPTSSAAS